MINKSPDVKWINDLAKEIERDPETLFKHIRFFESRSLDRIDNSDFKKCVKGEDFRKKRKRCIISTARFSKENKNPFPDIVALLQNNQMPSGGILHLPILILAQTLLVLKITLLLLRAFLMIFSTLFVM